MNAPEQPAATLVVNPRVRIPHSEFEFTFARSSGPGGQNVNKVNSKAILRWPVEQSPTLPEEIRIRLATQQRRRMTREGDLLVTSQRYRDQGRNIEDCLEKLREMLVEAAIRPVIRKKVKPTRGMIERRLKQKREHSGKKDARRTGHLTSDD
jgi:ribosome-associated protein